MIATGQGKVWKFYIESGKIYYGKFTSLRYNKAISQTD